MLRDDRLFFVILPELFLLLLLFGAPDPPPPLPLERELSVLLDLDVKLLLITLLLLFLMPLLLDDAWRDDCMFGTSIISSAVADEDDEVLVEVPKPP